MGTWTRVMRATLVAHSGESAAATAMRVLTRCMSATAICDRAAKAAQMVVVASQVVAATSASGIATGERCTAAVRSTSAALALMEAAHAHLVAVTAQIERSFSDNGRQPMAEELAIAERVRAAIHSCAA